MSFYWLLLYVCFNMVVKTFLSHRQKKLIYANQRKNGAADFIFFHQKMR